MDQKCCFRLAGSAQPLRHCLRGPLAGRLTAVTVGCSQDGNRNGLWKPWKNNLRFPTVPTASTTEPVKFNLNRLHKIFDTAVLGISINFPAIRNETSDAWRGWH